MKLEVKKREIFMIGLNEYSNVEKVVEKIQDRLLDTYITSSLRNLLISDSIGHFF
ncbi:hypothetical protein SAMN05444672_14616 [Bacillus sp. OK838]|nr:hypothetical protein SAMN05444672_14616 [Bacillus sp. OK838]